MVGSVQFDDEEQLGDLTLRAPEPVTIMDRLVRVRIAGSIAEAKMILAMIISVLIGVSIYLLASSVPEDPRLDDVQGNKANPLAYETKSARI